MDYQFKKIIYFVESPFCKRDFDRFGIEIIRHNGFEVEVWDFAPCLQPKRYQQFKILDTVNYEGYRLFFTKDEIKKRVSELTNDCFIVCIIGFNSNSYAVFRAISKKKIKYCVLMSNTLPIDNICINNKKLIFNNILNKIKKITPYKIFDFIFFRMPGKYIGISQAYMVLAGGENSLRSHMYPIGSKTEILWLHALDYDIYLKENDNYQPIDNRTGVFLDEYLPFHPDYLNLKLSPFSKPEEYYPLLCDFFDFIESTYKVNIVIAAHPRSDYEKHPDYFGGRSIIKGRTAELVKKSIFLIAHSSTSISFCVLFKKPVIFVTTNCLKKTYINEWIELMAESLRKKVINLNDFSSFNFEKELIVNEEAYKKYKNAYIKKTGSEELPFWQIFANHIKFLNDQMN